jgi:3-oxoacyl-[acyl-carrier-protein] synthase-3
VYGVTVAASLLQTSSAQKALVLVGDSLARQRLKDFERTSNTSLLFGDASAAIVIEKTEKEDVFYSALMSDGSGHKALSIPYGAWKHPVGPSSVPGDDIAVFNFTISEVPALLTEFMEKTGISIDQYDSLILHQANKMIMKQIAKKVKMPMEKVPICLDRFGNTSGASDPLTIVDRYGTEENGNIVKLLTAGYGVGLSWGVVSFEIKDTDILPLCISHDTYDDGYEDEYVNS